MPYLEILTLEIHMKYYKYLQKKGLYWQHMQYTALDCPIYAV